VGAPLQRHAERGEVANGRVLGPEGRPIPGLFAAGRATSGVSVGSYSSGLSLGDGTFFGRRAGRTAARP